MVSWQCQVVFVVEEEEDDDDLVIAMATKLVRE